MIDNTIVRTVEDTKNALSTKQIGDTLLLTLFRDDQILTISVTLQRSPIEIIQNETSRVTAYIQGPPSPFEPFNR